MLKIIVKIILPVFLISIFYLYGCGSDLPMDENINGSFTLINQDSNKVVFPDDFKGKIIVTGFIYTNCPDICPMTTHNMQLVQNKISDEGIKNVQFIGISFDPERDTPALLKKYSKLRDINEDNFQFLTGKKETISSLLKEMNVLAISADSSFTDSGEPIYFYTHTDRITIVDQEGHIRAEFSGSQANREKIIEDIKTLED